MERIFDTHAHYYDPKFDALEGGAESLLSSDEFRNTVSGVVNVGTCYENCLVCIEQARKYDFMHVAAGIHPSDAQGVCKLSPNDEISRIKSLVCDETARKANKIVAIGEIGLDYYWQPVSKELQLEYFTRQMSLAEELGLPVVIHDREAHGDTFDIICKYPSVKGVIHSCSMSAEMVKELTKRGWYISFSGPLTFKNASKVREACAATLLDKLLVETDAPYLAPVPFRGKINHSILMQNTLKVVADIHGISFDEAARITTQNAKNLFRM